MDECQLTTLADCLRQVPDPRCRRGVRHQWWVILTIIAAGLLCGQRDFRAIGQWARAKRPLLRRYLPLWQGSPPSEKTLQRAMSRLDLEAFKQQAYDFINATRLPAQGALDALSIDGKTLRGASHGGRKVHLLTLAAHADGAVLGRRNVGLKTNELAVAPLLLRDRDLRGQVVTGDAMFCHRELCRQVLRQGGHYLWEVKDNQPSLRADLIYLFDSPRGGPHPLTFWPATALVGGHGRIDERALEASDALNGHLDWPGLEQVVRRRCTRHINGHARSEDHYYVTSLPHVDAGPHTLLDLTRGHWGIENNVNRAQDVVFAEDASTLRTATAPEAMSVMRDLVMHILHSSSGFLLSDKLRDYQAYPTKALRALGLRRL
ncbi:MAG: ISAs1 family transposase [Burkholderiaceae bacterium]|nr:MAG: ISAs1 family transposase [Burkholderiaceae bacterium]